MITRVDRLRVGLRSTIRLRLPQLPHQQHRPFSTAEARWASKSRRPQGGLNMVTPRKAADKSVRIASKGESPAFRLPMIPDTHLTMPLGGILRTFRFTPKHIVDLVFIVPFRAVKSRAFNLFSLIVYKYSASPAISLNLRQTGPTGVALHAQNFAAFSSKDLATLKRSCTEGLYEDLVARIHKRDRWQRWEWKLIRYNGRTRVLSDKAMSLGKKGWGVRQAIVRIKSRQTLTYYNRDGTVIPGSGEPRDLVECIILQKLMMDGVEEEWEMWGSRDDMYVEVSGREETERIAEEWNKKHGWKVYLNCVLGVAVIYTFFNS